MNINTKNEITLDRNDSTLKVVNSILFLSCMLMNYLSTVGFIGKATQKEISAEWHVIIQPKGWAFSIWSIIFLLQAIFVIYQALPSQSKNHELIFEKISFWFSAQMVGFIFWIVTFGMDSTFWFGISLIFMALILTSSLKMLLASHTEKCNLVELITIRIQLSIISGWVTAASILNVSIFLKSCGLDSGEETWGLIILVVAFCIYSAFTLLEKNPLFGLIFVWVLIATPGWSDANTYILYSYITVLAGLTGLCVHQKI
jgi:benzodiazapine receptor